MGITSWPVAQMRHGDATTTKSTKDKTWDVTREGAMPHAHMKSHGCNAMTCCCKKRMKERGMVS